MDLIVYLFFLSDRKNELLRCFFKTVFWFTKNIMPLNDFGSTSAKSDNKMDTSLFVQKPYSKTNCIESNVGEDND